MTTAIVSDLHFGAASGGALLTRPGARRALLAGLEGADELVILGDLLELREAPVAETIAAARPLLEDLGRTFAGRHVTISAGNHDHQLAAGLVDAIRVRGDGARLEIDTLVEPPASGPIAAVAEALGDARVRLAYPGIWIRPDVYATHGHYLDLHNTVPTLERLAAGAVERVVGGLPDGRLTPLDYEAALGPLYSMAYNVAQASPRGRRLVGGSTSVRAWRALERSNGRRSLTALALGAVLVPGAVAALNRAGLGPLKPDLTAAELRRAGLRAMAAVLERLGVHARYAIFGHTHRSGPHPGDKGWTLPNGTRLTNSGSWVVEPTFLGRDPLASPYFPGTCVYVDADGPPRLVRLLDGVPD